MNNVAVLTREVSNPEQWQRRLNRREDEKIVACARLRHMSDSSYLHATTSPTHQQGVLAYEAAIRFLNLFVQIDVDTVEDRYDELCQRTAHLAEQVVRGELGRQGQLAVEYGIAEAKKELLQARNTGRKKARRR